MARKKKTEFLNKTVETLAKRAGYICSNPDCRKHTTLAHSQKNKAVLIGEAAHIKGQSPKTARHDPGLSDEEIRDINNGIWVCRDCHKKIDSDERKYTRKLLQQWKEVAESSRGDYREIIEETTADIKEAFKEAKEDKSNKQSFRVQSVLDYAVTTEYQSELDHARDLINNRHPKAALTLLENLKKRVFQKANNSVKFRILTNMGASKLSLEEEKEACRLFIEAYQYNAKNEKALANMALAYMINGKKQKALRR